ncbi:hypothetical protein MKEN_00224900 [Mycena kentingensis (nom. inval.)]|nr:hypothetical protein MKEN_00224900 [Mycena kentingensis (nom. inval.)]
MRALRVLALVPGSLAQAQQFFWGFNSSLTTSLPVCSELPLTVTPGAASGVPPFYMLAFAEGAAPTTQLIGKNASSLSWTVDHPVGSKLILGVVDAHGTSGGVDIPLYAVVAGSSTACLPPATATDFVVTSTTPHGDMLNTCDPWNLLITGGTPPYSVSIAALNASDVTNITMAATDTVFQYINRADPGSQMIAAISDSTGRWATGSPFVRTNGTTEFDCAGRESIGGTNDTIPISLPPADSESSSNNSRPVAAIIGAAVGGAALLLILLAALGVLFYRTRALTREAKLYRGAPPPVPVPFLTIPSPASGEGLTPFVLPDSGSRWSKGTPTPKPTSASPSDGRRSPSTITRELPPPYAYVTHGHPLPPGAASASGGTQSSWRDVSSKGPGPGAT